MATRDRRLEVAAPWILTLTIVVVWFENRMTGRARRGQAA